MKSLYPSPHGSTSPCRVLLADDHGIVRASVRCLLEGSGGFEVVAEAADGEQAVEMISHLEPDVAVVDLGMPKVDGIEVIRRVAAAGGATKVLALTASEEGRHVREALEAGAAGFLPKAAAGPDLLGAVRAVACGGHYVHPSVLADLFKAEFSRREPEPGALTSRESSVLRLISLGYSNKEISSQLSLSVKTVETYKARGMDKIGVASRVGIVRHAISRGWLCPEAGSVSAREAS